MQWKRRIRPLYRWGTKLPPVIRSLLGVLLIGAGVLGAVLPVLGVWMVPLGVLFVALDVPPWRRRVEAWLGPEA